MHVHEEDEQADGHTLDVPGAHNEIESAEEGGYQVDDGRQIGFIGGVNRVRCNSTRLWIHYDENATQNGEYDSEALFATWDDSNEQTNQDNVKPVNVVEHIGLTLDSIEGCIDKSGSPQDLEEDCQQKGAILSQ